MSKAKDAWGHFKATRTNDHDKEFVLSTGLKLVRLGSGRTRTGGRL